MSISFDLLLKIKLHLFFKIVNLQNEYARNILQKYVSFPPGFQLGIFIRVTEWKLFYGENLT